MKFSIFHIGTSETLPGGETLCDTCASPCASPGNTNTTNNNTSFTNDGKSWLYNDFRIINTLNGMSCKKTALICITIQWRKQSNRELLKEVKSIPVAHI